MSWGHRRGVARQQRPHLRATLRIAPRQSSVMSGGARRDRQAFSRAHSAAALRFGGPAAARSASWTSAQIRRLSGAIAL